MIYLNAACAVVNFCIAMATSNRTSFWVNMGAAVLNAAVVMYFLTK